MTSFIPAALLATALGIAFPVVALGQVPNPESTPPPEAPVKISVPQPQPATVSAPGSAVGRVDAPDETSAQRGGGGRGGGGNRDSGGGSPRGGGVSGGDAGGRGGYPGGGYRWGHPAGGGRYNGWWGPSPVYLARPYYYDPFWVSGAFGWSPMFYAPWSLMWAAGGYGPYPGWGYGAATFNTGGLRLKVRPRDAQVFVDGFMAGVVDEFDGVFQALRLAPGGHKIEVRMPGFETLTFDVHIQPDRTMTITEGMKANP